jgi:hypothetical protein
MCGCRFATFPTPPAMRSGRSTRQSWHFLQDFSDAGTVQLLADRVTPMIKRRNSINDQWSARRREMLESPAYRVLSQSAHRAISRLELELCYHGGNDNGKLPVTFDDFVEYGIDRASVAPALREGEALGFFRITERGRGGNREYRTPNKFYLTFARGRESRTKPPTDEWRKIKTIVEAKAIARDARAAKDQRAVARGKKQAEKRKERQKRGAGKSHISMVQTHTENENGSVRELHTTGSPEKPVPLSISRVGEPRRPPRALINPTTWSEPSPVSKRESPT